MNHQSLTITGIKGIVYILLNLKWSFTSSKCFQLRFRSTCAKGQNESSMVIRRGYFYRYLIKHSIEKKYSKIKLDTMIHHTDSRVDKIGNAMENFQNLKKKCVTHYFQRNDGILL